MASELYVETLKGLTSGANANKVIIPSGQTLDASAGGFTTPAGHVIQVVSAENTARDSISSGSFTATSLSGSITPTSSSSKILITISSGCNTQGSTGRADLTIYRGSTNLTTQTDGMMYVKGDNSRIQIPIAFSFLDSPSTTSSTTYTLYARNNGVTANIEVPPSTSQLTTITLMEIAG